MVMVMVMVYYKHGINNSKRVRIRVRKIEKHATISKNRKLYWLGKFIWFISSENFLNTLLLGFWFKVMVLVYGYGYGFGIL